MSEFEKDVLEKLRDSIAEQMLTMRVESEEFGAAAKNLKLINDALIDCGRLKNDRYRIETDSYIKEKEISADADTNLAKLYEQRKDRRNDGVFKALTLFCSLLTIGVTVFAEETRNVLVSHVPQMVKILPKL